MTYPPSSSPPHCGRRDPSLPCSSCGKRHARSHDNDIVGASITNPIGKSSSKKSASAIVTVILALLSSSPSAAAKAAAVHRVPSTGAVSSPQSENATASARSSRRGAGDGPDGTWAWRDLFASSALPGVVTKEGRSLAEDDVGAVLDDAHDHDDGAHDHDHDDAHVHEGEETEGLNGHDQDHDHDALSLSQAEASTSSSVGKGVSAKQWGQILGVTLLVNLASLAGLLLLAFPVMRRHYSGKKEDSVEQQQQHGKTNKTKFERLVHICLPAFVVGALLATAAFLLFPEALHLISGTHHEEHGADDGGEEGHDEHHDHRFLQDEDHGGHDDHGDGESVAAAKFGVSFLGGFLLPFVFSLLFPHSHGHPHDRSHRLEHGHDDDDDDDDALSSGKEDDAKSLFASDEEECASCKASARDDSDVARDAHVGVSVTAIPIADRDEVNINHQKTPSAAPRDTSATAIAPTPLPPKTLLDKSLILSIITGDFLCNFADGIFVTAALLHCPGPTFLSILLVTILHELPQEFADFFLLVEYAGLTVFQASVVNFLSGLSVTLGGIVVAAGNPSDETVGVVIAMAGGAYVSIAACETLPRMEKWVEGRMDRLAMMAAFVAGTIPFGLVLLKHEHCG